MKNTYKQCAVIASQWVPNNPIRAFLPFVYSYVVCKEPKKITLEEISKQLDELYGLHLTYSLLRTILQYLKNNGEATLSEGGFWDFNLREKNYHTIDINNINQDEISQLVNGFVEFLGDGYTLERAEQLINSFFCRYDYEILNGQVSSINERNLDDNDYFVAEYIKALAHQNAPILDFIVKIAQGSIIKSAITSENLQLTVFSGKSFYFDTKIVFRLLGYYGEYYEKEYCDLILRLKSQQAKLYITEYVYNEIVDILRGCARYIDSADYQYEKASDVLRYFRALDLSKTDIQLKISGFEEILKTKYGILVDRKQIFNEKSLKRSEDYQRIKDIIVEKYGYRNEEFSYVYGHGLETDLRSILHAYIERGNNESVLIKDASLFFVTSNAALIKSVMKYHSEVYGKTLSPIISDTFLGVLLYGTSNGLPDYTKIKLLAFCNEAYRPSLQQRETFIAFVEKALAEKKITSDQTFLLKHYELIDDVLVNQLRENDFNINDDCVYEALAEIQHRLVGDVSASYERKLQERERGFTESLHNEEKNHQKSLKAKEEKHTTQIMDLYNREMRTHKIIFSILYYAASLLVFVAALFVFFIPMIFNTEIYWHSIVYMVASSVVALMDLIALIINIKSKKLLNYFLEKKAKKIKLIYQIT